jgi:NAD(P)H dehydrogenase (quinone)
MSKILITGATGHLGKAVVNSLLKKNVDNFVVLVRDPSKVEDLKAKNVEIRQGDYNNYNSLVAAFKGVDKLFFVSGNDIESRLKQHENVVKAAKEAGVKHVVYTSFQRVNETETSPIALISDAHIKTEQWLKEAGLTYTILKNSLYMDGILMFIGDKVLESGVIYLPAGDGKAAYVLREDMAEASAVILTTNGHENKIYEFAADKIYSYAEIAEIISQLTGKKISYVSPSLEEYNQALTSANVPEIYIKILGGFSDAIKQGEFAETSTVLETLLGRKLVGITEYLKSVYVK